jgi:hypothetical protein
VTVRKSLFISNGNGGGTNVLGISGAIGIREVDGDGNGGSFSPSLDLGHDVSGEYGTNKFRVDNSKSVDHWPSGVLKAEKNCWSDSSPAGEIDNHGTGSVDFSPKFSVNNSACKQEE